ncbi:unannotated protein [freshwater metagenome]|uniref:Unannotated protein n=1 Tax=freshwater metagenome TaxID=449393 RepID=A0A6J6W401_9ZZZZ
MASLMFMPATDGTTTRVPGPTKRYQLPRPRANTTKNAIHRLRLIRALVRRLRSRAVSDVLSRAVFFATMGSTLSEVCALFSFETLAGSRDLSRTGAELRSNSKLSCLRFGSIIASTCLNSCRNSSPSLGRSSGLVLVARTIRASRAGGISGFNVDGAGTLSLTC